MVVMYIPKSSEFDLFCVGPGEETRYFTSYDEVDVHAESGQVDDRDDIHIVSSDPPSTTVVRVHVNALVPATWTLDFIATFVSLPPSFDDHGESHIFIGGVDHQGASAGLFFSKAGIGYSGALFHNGSDPVILTHPFQVIPDSVGVVEEGESYRIRLVVDWINSIVLVYCSELAESITSPLRLIAIMPALASDGLYHITDGAYISVKGTVSDGSAVIIHAIAMAGSPIYPGLLPIADSGTDQSIRACSVVQLDGSGSFDPDGVIEKFQWRFVDGPTTSQFVFEGFDGFTSAGVTLSNKIYSPSLGEYSLLPGSEVVPGNVLCVQGRAFWIVETGFDLLGKFYVILDESSIEPDVSGLHIRLVKQHGLSGPTTEKPTFFPDEIGLYKFELKVFDGTYWSAPSTVIVNVMASVVPRGVVPNTSFLWNYISDFWNLVQNKEHIETFWSAAAQITASEMLTLWQIEYNKSLRDIQNTFQRRWLHYDLLLSVRNIYLGAVENSEPIVGDSGFGEGYIFEVGVSLGDEDVQEDDLLLIDGEGYRILRVVMVEHLSTEHWKVTLKDPLPRHIEGKWCIGRGSKAAIDFYNNLVTEGDLVNFEIENLLTEELSFETETILGVSVHDHNSLVHTQNSIRKFLDDSKRYAVRISSVHRRKYMPIVDLVVTIPHLQERITYPNEHEVLRQNIDYYLESVRGTKCIRFVVGDSDVWCRGTPPKRMWAEITILDNRPIIEANFGIPAEFTLENLNQIPSHLDYLSAVRGIWYAHFWGPTIRNLRIGTQILLGLPFAEKTGFIEEIRTDFGSSRGRILVRDQIDDEIVRFYTYPNVLPLEINPATGKEYKVGDLVIEFSPLDAGVEVVDYINKPDWFAGYMNQGVFYEIEKFFKFLVRVDSAAFSLSSLMFVRAFLLRIKPTYTFPMFVVLHHIDADQVDVSDSIKFRGCLRLTDGLCRRTHGSFGRWDDFRSGSGGYTSAYDSGKPHHVDPIWPKPYHPVPWGYDKTYLCPNESIHAIMSATFDGTTKPIYDSIFAWDLPVAVHTPYIFEFPQVDFLTGYDCIYSSEITCLNTITITGMRFEWKSIGGFPAGMGVSVSLLVDGVERVSTVFSGMSSGIEQKGWIDFGEAVTLEAGSIVHMGIKANALPGVSIPWMKLLFWMGDMYYWSYDMLVPAGTYYSVRLL